MGLPYIEPCARYVTVRSLVSVSHHHALLRPDDLNLIKATLRLVHGRLSNAVTFGGIYHGQELAISEVFGARTRALNNLMIPIGQSIGGRAAVEGRPIGAGNYYQSSMFTREFDGYVRREGLMAIHAIPVMVNRKPRGMLYTAKRDGSVIGERFLYQTVTLAQQISQEMKVRDEVDRRMQVLEIAQQAPQPEY